MFNCIRIVVYVKFYISWNFFERSLECIDVVSNNVFFSPQIRIGKNIVVKIVLRY